MRRILKKELRIQNWEGDRIRNWEEDRIRKSAGDTVQARGTMTLGAGMVRVVGMVPGNRRSCPDACIRILGAGRVRVGNTLRKD